MSEYRLIAVGSNRLFGSLNRALHLMLPLAKEQRHTK